MLLYKRLVESRFQWLCSADEIREIALQQFRCLMEGLAIIAPQNFVRIVNLAEYAVDFVQNREFCDLAMTGYDLWR